MTRYLIAYVADLVVFLGLDFVWLSVMGSRLYRPYLGDMMLERPVLWAAAAFYLFYVAGAVFFAIAPALRAESWSKALLLGAGLGFMAYMTYNFTNMATLRNWSIAILAADTTWGTLATAVSATAAYFIARLTSAS
jgi:uncharacterized membrane protein